MLEHDAISLFRRSDRGSMTRTASGTADLELVDLGHGDVADARPARVYVRACMRDDEGWREKKRGGRESEEGREGGRKGRRERMRREKECPLSLMKILQALTKTSDVVVVFRRDPAPIARAAASKR